MPASRRTVTSTSNPAGCARALLTMVGGDAAVKLGWPCPPITPHTEKPATPESPQWLLSQRETAFQEEASLCDDDKASGGPGDPGMGLQAKAQPDPVDVTRGGGGGEPSVPRTAQPTAWTAVASGGPPQASEGGCGAPLRRSGAARQRPSRLDGNESESSPLCACSADTGGGGPSPPLPCLLLSLPRRPGCHLHARNPHATAPSARPDPRSCQQHL